MSAANSLTRLRAVAGIVAQRAPAVLTATITFLEAVLEADRAAAAERTPTAPVTLTAEQVLEAARARGVPAFTGPVGDRLILLASLGLDLTAPGIRAALVELHRRGELQLVHIDNVAAVRADLAARGLPIELVEESAITAGDTTFHVVVGS